ncbi:gata transcription factor 9 [Phtheirospermum japonicum]|uniref:GATA transcription factor n=1 Tax=Phtheirospermum japonicum TaxID=374723 RepID=A0A830CCG1_9LAMI|nr:gata transcription factor 9 [Phtheirospermum japonicum]
MGPNIVDEIDCGNLFDQIDDLIDFPPDNECGGDGNLVGSGDGMDFATWNDALTDCDPFLSGSHVNSAPDFSAELSVPYEDIVQLEWLSTFVEDSFSSIGLTLGKDNLCNNESSANKFQTSSPVSVFESSSSSSSSSSIGKTMPPLSQNHCGPQRARSKRPRPATFNPRPAIRLISPSSSSDHFIESPTKKIRKSTGEEYIKMNKKIKITMPSAATPPDDNTIQAVRKCLHCEITKTPQWRAGPMGPKTLCNACGVRYKSGRLFPEYRPAASPTFVPSLHSNSHKKVVEMRSKFGHGNEVPAHDTTSEDLEVAPNA